MESTLAEVLDAARALPRSERAEVAQELIASLENADEFDEVRYAELRDAVSRGITDLDAGRSRRVAVDDLGSYLQERGRLATGRAARSSH